MTCPGRTRDGEGSGWRQLNSAAWQVRPLTRAPGNLDFPEVLFLPTFVRHKRSSSLLAPCSTPVSRHQSSCAVETLRLLLSVLLCMGQPKPLQSITCFQASGASGRQKLDTGWGLWLQMYLSFQPRMLVHSQGCPRPQEPPPVSTAV